MSDKEKAAKTAHDIWAHWMRYMFTQCNPCMDGEMVIPAEKVERWKRQMETEYDDLLESEKQSDREIAERFGL